MDGDGLHFDDLVPIEVPVSVNGAQYILREANGDAACRYRNAVMECVEMVDGKPARVHGMANTEPLLVAMCLRTADGKLVGEATVRSWPPRVIKVLFAKAKEISDLEDEVAEGAAKNVLVATPAGSV